MNTLVANPYFQIAVGAVVSLGGSFLANLWFFGKTEKKRAKRETLRAYKKLLNRLVQTSITDIQNPLHVMPVDISDRIEDLRFTLRDVNPEFSLQALVQQAIHQSAELRKKQDALYRSEPRSG